MQGDGDGWVRCALGHTHWGKYGAAGVMIRQDQRTVLQHRALWTHEGGTWAVPGGARDSDEDIVTTALREADEEADIDPTWLRPIGAWITDHTGWTYATIVASPVGTLRLSSANPESEDMRWWDDELISAMPLHSGFALAWGELTEPPLSTTIVVDGANVVGSRPDGWWNDRLGAARALRDQLRHMVRMGISPQDEHMPATALHVLFPRVLLVVEGEAAPLAQERPVEEVGEKPLFKPSYTIRGPRVAPWWERAVEVEAADPARSGDDEVVARVAEAQANGEHIVLVTADRELRDRVSAIAPAARHAGPAWLLDSIDAAAAAEHAQITEGEGASPPQRPGF